MGAQKTATRLSFFLLGEHPGNPGNTKHRGTSRSTRARVVRFPLMSEERKSRWSAARVSPRYAMDQRLIIKAGAMLHGRTKDISESGLGATVAGELKMHDSVELEFYLPGSLVPQRFLAEVRYRRGFQYGFCFLNATDQQRSLIRETALYLTLAT
jgi:PilZ domain